MLPDNSVCILIIFTHDVLITILKYPPREVLKITRSGTMSLGCLWNCEPTEKNEDSMLL